MRMLILLSKRRLLTDLHAILVRANRLTLPFAFVEKVCIYARPAKLSGPMWKTLGIFSWNPPLPRSSKSPPAPVLFRRESLHLRAPRQIIRPYVEDAGHFLVEPPARPGVRDYCLRRSFRGSAANPRGGNSGSCDAASRAALADSARAIESIRGALRSASRRGGRDVDRSRQLKSRYGHSAPFSLRTSLLHARRLRRQHQPLARQSDLRLLHHD